MTHVNEGLQVASPKGHWYDIYVKCNDKWTLSHDRCKQWFSQAVTAWANPIPPNPKPMFEFVIFVFCDWMLLS